MRSHIHRIRNRHYIRRLMFIVVLLSLMSSYFHKKCWSNCAKSGAILKISMIEDGLNTVTVSNTAETKTNNLSQNVPEKKICTNEYIITWFRLPYYISNFPKAINAGFSDCEYSNCLLLIGPSHVQDSDAVIFDALRIKPNDRVNRLPGQVWIFYAHEPPATFLRIQPWARGDWISSFNWTMTYDKSNSDIHLPYGEIRSKEELNVSKNYSKIFRMKKKFVLIVYSHCSTVGERESYIRILQRYIDIDSFGKCGIPWDCGQRLNHDNCFDIINNYKFYLAFENAICNNYFTEKMYQNFNYDSIMVVRGGRNNDSKRIFPDGTFISTEDFTSIKHLADFLKMLAGSEELYTKILRRKDEYYSVPYETVYHKAMCNVCERMNKQDEYRKQIKNTVKWMHGRKRCKKPSDLIEF